MTTKSSSDTEPAPALEAHRTGLPEGRPMPGGYIQFDAADVVEALAFAERFKAEGRYRYFRGQRDSSWKVRPTLARLSPGERQSEWEKFTAFYQWAKSSPELIPYLSDDDGLIAAAQHHGIAATPFIDFSTDPAVAAWFAADRGLPGDHGAIFMVDPDQVEPIFAAFSESRPGLRFLHVDVANLWRLQAQRGLFLEAQIDLDHVWPLDRVVFPQTGAMPGIEQRRIYPDRKSHLEQMIEQHLLLQEREEKMRQFLAGGNFVRLDMGDPPDLKPADFTAPALADSLVSSPDERWTAMDLDTPPPVLSPERLLAAGPELEALIETRRQSTDLLLVDPAPRWQGTTVQPALDALWAGMRPHPYTSAHISRSIAALIRFNQVLGDFPIGSGISPKVAAPRLLQDPLEIEMGIAGGGSTRTCVTASRLYAALSPAARDLIGIAEAAGGPGLVHALLPFRGKTLFLFEPSVLLDLFADEIVPWQVLAKRHPTAFWPTHIVSLGPP